MSQHMRISIKDNILFLHFQGKREKMNKLLDPISNRYEGEITHREGHNFPSECIPLEHQLSKYKDKCQYVIAVYNSQSIQHEKLHAKYYLDSTYRQEIQDEWNNLPTKVQEHISKFLRKLGYSDKVLLDEYQAYRYSEASNFFGIRL